MQSCKRLRMGKMPAEVGSWNRCGCRREVMPVKEDILPELNWGYQSSQ